MVKICILLFSFILTGCSNCSMYDGAIVVGIANVDDKECNYEVKGNRYFSAPCGRFNIGDTIQIIKK